MIGPAMPLMRVWSDGDQLRGTTNLLPVEPVYRASLATLVRVGAGEIPQPRAGSLAIGRALLLGQRSMLSKRARLCYRQARLRLPVNGLPGVTGVGGNRAPIRGSVVPMSVFAMPRVSR